MKEKRKKRLFFISLVVYNKFLGKREGIRRPRMNSNNTNELLSKINEKYARLSKGQKLLAEYIAENYDKAVF